MLLSLHVNLIAGDTIMKVAINGTSGFVGAHLVLFFKERGHEVVEIKREFYNDISTLQNLLHGCDGVINLAGATISKKWTKAYKKVMRESRIKTTENLVLALQNMENPPQHLVSTSAVGIYQEGQSHDESSIKFDNGFLGNLAKEWEAKAQKAKINVSVLRLGVVLGNGGALNEMLPIFKLGFGGVLGSGKQSFSWIHIKDLVRAYEFVLQTKGDVFNLTAPHPTTNEVFTKTLGQILHKTTIFKVPTFALKLKFGEGATILLKGQKVYPNRLLEKGFVFEYKNIYDALNDLL